MRKMSKKFSAEARALSAFLPNTLTRLRRDGFQRWSDEIERRASALPPVDGRREWLMPLLDSRAILPETAAGDGEWATHGGIRRGIWDAVCQAIYRLRFAAVQCAALLAPGYRVAPIVSIAPILMAVGYAALMAFVGSAVQWQTAAAPFWAIWGLYLICSLVWAARYVLDWEAVYMLIESNGAAKERG